MGGIWPSSFLGNRLMYHAKCSLLHLNLCFSYEATIVQEHSISFSYLNICFSCHLDTYTFYRYILSSIRANDRLAWKYSFYHFLLQNVNILSFIKFKIFEIFSFDDHAHLLFNLLFGHKISKWFYLRKTNYFINFIFKC